MNNSYEFLQIADMLIQNGFQPTDEPKHKQREDCYFSIFGNFIDLYIFTGNYAEVVIHSESDYDNEYKEYITLYYEK